MPKRTAKACNECGAAHSNPGPYCDEHTRLREQRGSSSSRGYGHKWRATREIYLARHPLCERCKAKHGRDTEADTVHHITPKRFGGRDHFDNFMALCRECHEIIEGRKKEER